MIFIVWGDDMFENLDTNITTILASDEICNLIKYVVYSRISKDYFKFRGYMKCLT